MSKVLSGLELAPIISTDSSYPGGYRQEVIIYGGSSSIADSLVVDAVGAYWYTILTEASTNGTPTISYINLSTGALGTPSAPVKPAATNKTVQTVETQYNATGSGTGYSVGDALLSVMLIDSSTTTILSSAWINAATQLIIATPSSSNIVKADSSSVSVSNFPTTQPVSGTVSVASDGLTGVAVPSSADYVGFSGAGGLLTGVSATNQLPVTNTVGATNYFGSTNNSTVAQLGAGASFTGIIETVLSQQAITVSLTSDQPGTFVINQFIDSAGTFKCDTWTYSIVAGVPLNIAYQISGNYVNVVFTNNGGVSTTTLNISTYYGTLPSTTSLGNNPSAINEIGGKAFALGPTSPALSLPTTYADNVQLYTGTISTTGTGAWLDTNGFNSVIFQAVGLEGLMTIEGSVDAVNSGGPLMFLPLSEFSLIDTVTESGIYSLRPGPRYIRWNVSNVSTGSFVLTIVGRNNNGPSAADNMSLALDPIKGVPMGVQIVSGAGRADPSGAMILSDAPVNSNNNVIDQLVSTSTIIDTTGYSSITITTNSLYQGTVTMSSDGINWAQGVGASINGGNPTASIVAAGSYIFPCHCRFIKITCTVAGAFTYYLRNQQVWAQTATTQVNLSTIASTAAVTGGVAGLLAVGGNIAQGTARTANPLPISGVDSANLTRTLLTDTTGKPIVAAQDALANYKPLPLTTTTTISGTAALPMLDVGLEDGQSVKELLAAMLREQMITNHYLCNIVQQFNPGFAQTDEPAAFRNDPSFFNQ